MRKKTRVMFVGNKTTRSRTFENISPYAAAHKLKDAFKGISTTIDVPSVLERPKVQTVYLYLSDPAKEGVHGLPVHTLELDTVIDLVVQALR